MNPELPFETPARMPSEISPSPIMQTGFELRFVATESWSVMPGMLYRVLRERYPRQHELPLARLPESVRREDPSLAHLPLIKFENASYIIQLGPRVLALSTAPWSYPGWVPIQQELTWLMQRVAEAGFVGEVERLGVRYINYFPENLFDHLVVNVLIAEVPLPAKELRVYAILEAAPFQVKFEVSSGAVVKRLDGTRAAGSVLDLDVWLGPMEIGAMETIPAQFARAHDLAKRTFFGLLAPDYMNTLDPKYAP